MSREKVVWKVLYLKKVDKEAAIELAIGYIGEYENRLEKLSGKNRQTLKKVIKYLSKVISE